MAKRKDDNAAREGFKIPIEDGAGQVAAEAKGPDAAGSDGIRRGQGEGESAQNQGAGSAAAATAAAGAAATPSAAAASTTANEAGSASANVAADGTRAADANAADDDIVAEAEAVVEEAASVAGSADDLEKARQEASDWQDRYMRLHAEWDTYRRRTSEQRAEEKARATEKLVEDLIPVLDDFDRTVSYAEENGEVGLLDGVKAVQTKLIDALKKSSLEVIDPAGDPYDALEAQAVATVPDAEAFDETVKDVYQKGYKMGKKVLRPAMVTVTTGGPKRPKEEPEE